MALPQGIAFRNTLGFVTDGANDSAEHSAGVGFLGVATYPRTTAQGQTVGWEISGGSVSTRDRNSGIDARLAGGNFNTNVGTETFRIDLPTTGSKNVRLAMGDANYATNAKVELFDTATSRGVLSSGTTSAGGRFRDATNVERTSAADWVTNNAAQAVTFTTTILRLVVGDGAVSAHTIAYFYVEDGGASGPNITGTSSANPVDGSSLTITGTAFLATQGSGGATIGGTNVVETSWADTSIVATVALGLNKYGVTLDVVVTDNAAASSAPFAITSVQPVSGWSFVDIATPNANPALRVTGTPVDLGAGDQVRYDNQGGLVTIVDDGTLSWSPGVLSTTYAIWRTGFGYGADATITFATLDPGPPSYPMFGGMFGAGSFGMVFGIVPAAGGPIIAPTGLSSETDAALALARRKTKALGLSAQSDASLTLGRVKRRAVGLSAESDASLALGHRFARTVGLSAESDAALALGRVSVRALSLSSESDSALARTAAKARAAGVSTEQDLSLALGRVKARAVGLSSEQDSAFALAPAGNILPAGLSVEQDSALALGRIKSKAVGLSQESDAALALGEVKARAAGVAVEQDQALSLGRRKSRAVGLASEADTALGLSPGGVQAVAVGLCVESDQALALDAVKVGIVGVPFGVGGFSEFSGAVAKTKAEPKPRTPRVRAPKPVPRPVLRVIALPVGMASTFETALALAPVRIPKSTPYVMQNGLLRTVREPRLLRLTCPVCGTAHDGQHRST